MRSLHPYSGADLRRERDASLDAIKAVAFPRSPRAAFVEDANDNIANPV